GLTVAATVTFSSTASPLPVISVCELIQHPDKWEGKVVAVRGALLLPQSGTPVVAGMGVFLVPAAPDKCNYSESVFISSDEPPRFMLEIADNHFRAHPGVLINDSSIASENNRLQKLRKLHPAAWRAIVVVEGFVGLRKYNLPQVERSVA